MPKPPGRFRIIALGDSFTFGLVPYPHNVMTLLEARLRAVCPSTDLDILNFGIGGGRSPLPCIDLTPVFVEASRSSAEALYKQRDAHWTIRGNRVAADAEAEFLAGLVCPPGSPAPSAATR